MPGSCRALILASTIAATKVGLALGHAIDMRLVATGVSESFAAGFHA
jgi:hypothetical protein